MYKKLWSDTFYAVLPHLFYATSINHSKNVQGYFPLFLAIIHISFSLWLTWKQSKLTLQLIRNFFSVFWCPSALVWGRDQGKCYSSSQNTICSVDISFWLQEWLSHFLAHDKNASTQIKCPQPCHFSTLTGWRINDYTHDTSLMEKTKWTFLEK